MKRLILLTAMVCLLVTAHALANPTPGYITNGDMGWSRGDHGTTWQEWDFLDDDGVASPESSYNPYGSPAVELYQIEVANPITPFGWHANCMNRAGVWSGDAVYADIIIPNTDNTSGSKVVWMEVGYAAALVDQEPTIEPFVAGGQPGDFECELLSKNTEFRVEGFWNVMTVSWLITPNPQSEVITVGFAGTGGFIDYISVDTQCTAPVPGAVVLCGIGAGLVGWFRRKRMA